MKHSQLWVALGAVFVVVGVIDHDGTAQAAPPSTSPSTPEPRAAVAPPISVTWGTGTIYCSNAAFKIMNGVEITNGTREEISGQLFIDKSNALPVDYRVRPNNMERYQPTTPEGFMSCNGPLRSVSVHGTGPAFPTNVMGGSTRTYRPWKGFHQFGPSPVLPDSTKGVWMQLLSSDLNCNENGATATINVKVRNGTGAATFGEVKLTYQTFTKKLIRQLPASTIDSTMFTFDTGLPIDCSKGFSSASYELSTANDPSVPPTVKPPPVINPSGLAPLMAVYFSVGP